MHIESLFKEKCRFFWGTKKVLEVSKLQPARAFCAARRAATGA